MNKGFFAIFVRTLPPIFGDTSPHFWGHFPPFLGTLPPVFFKNGHYFLGL